MRICIIGVTGFIGQKLLRHILRNSSDTVVGFSRSASTIDVRSTRYEPVDGSIFDTHALTSALAGCDAAIYLFHMMGTSETDFEEGEARAADSYCTAASGAGIRRTVFLGGLGDPKDPGLSKHLRSRQSTGRTLRERLPGVVELQASMIIGIGSAGFDIIKAISDSLPIIVIPRWAVTNTQPIRSHDAISYIYDGVRLPNDTYTLGIGGPEILTYRDIALRYSEEVAAKHHILHRQPVWTIPGIPRWAAVRWLDRFAGDKAGKIGGPMVDSLRNEMIVRDSEALRLFPHIKPSRISFVNLDDTDTI